MFSMITSNTNSGESFMPFDTQLCQVRMQPAPKNSIAPSRLRGSCSVCS